MAEDRYRVSLAVYALMVRNGVQGKPEILIMRRSGGYGADQYSVPAGHLDPDESLAAALVREISEEVGIDVEESALSQVLSMHTAPERAGDLADQRLDIWFSVNDWSGEPTIMEPDKCDDLAWVPHDALPDNVLPRVRAALQAIAAGQSFVEFGFPEHAQAMTVSPTIPTQHAARGPHIETHTSTGSRRRDTGRSQLG